MRVTAISAPYKYLFLIVTALFASSCTDLSEYDNEQVRSSLNDSLITTTESWDIEMVLLRDGNARIFIEGSRAVSYQSPDKKQTNIDGPVYVQLFDTTGAVETEAWSNRAVYRDSTSEFELYDSVRVQTATQRELYSDYLLWSQETDLISSSRFVTIITPEDSIAGRGFEGVTDLSTFTIDDISGHVIID